MLAQDEKISRNLNHIRINASHRLPNALDLEHKSSIHGSAVIFQYYFNEIPRYFDTHETLDKPPIGFEIGILLDPLDITSSDIRAKFTFENNFYSVFGPLL